MNQRQTAIDLLFMIESLRCQLPNRGVRLLPDRFGITRKQNGWHIVLRTEDDSRKYGEIIDSLFREWAETDASPLLPDWSVQRLLGPIPRVGDMPIDGRGYRWLLSIERPSEATEDSATRTL